MYQTGNVSIAASNRERRIFRGRGGPKDGNLPRSRRRVNKSSSTNEEQIPKYATPIIPINNDETTTHVATKSNDDLSSTKSDDNDGTHLNNRMLTEEYPSHDLHNDNDDNDDGVSNNEQQTNQLVVGEEDKQLKEIKHLRKRIFNIQESIKLSNDALCKPKIWEANCLNAVHNCVGEWRSIVAYYTAKVDYGAELRKEISVEIFGLVQMAMQSGPLTGAKPGYFKRCGHEVAGIAHRFLLKTVSGDSITDLVSPIHFFFSPIADLFSYYIHDFVTINHLFI